MNALVQTVSGTPESAREDELLRLLAAGTPIKAIAVHAALHAPEAVADDVERLFRVLAEQAGAGVESALRRLRHVAPGDRRPREAG